MKHWTPNQKKAIYDTLDSDVIVSASAGSGKTSAMVERVLTLITKRRVPISKIMLLTFTNNSAGEMKERLRQGLLSYAKENPEEASFIREQLDNMGQADISTIHGFCFKIVQEFFEVVGLSPSVGILPDEEKSDYLAKAGENTIKRCEEDDEICALMDNLSLRKDNVFLKIVQNLYEYVTAQPDRKEWLEHCLSMYHVNNSFEKSNVSEYAANYFSTIAKIYSNQLRELIEVARANGYVKCAKFGLNALNQIQIYENCRTMHELYNCFVMQLENQKKPRTSEDLVLINAIDDIKKESIKNIVDKLKNIFDCGENYEEMVENRTKAGLQVSNVIKAVSIFEEEYDKIKAEQNVIDFSDMERYTVEILNDPILAEEIRDRHDYVFVDEFQDTNYIQDKIIRTVTKPDRLFIVGDVKQCIYRFRLAEPNVFIQTLEEWDKENKAIYFNDNFRSDNEILNFVNHIYGLLMTKNFGNIDYNTNGKFSIKENQNESEIDSVTILKAPCVETKKDNETKPSNPVDENGIYDITKHELSETEGDEIEAGLIYNYIKSILGKKIYVKGEEKVVEYSDIVLMYGKRNAPKITLQTLSAAGIPINIGDFEASIGKEELDVFFDYLEVINNLYDDYPLISALHSFIGGFGNRELAQIKTKYPNATSFYSSCKFYYQNEDDEIAKKLKGFFDKAAEYRFLATFTEMSEFLKLVLEGTGFATYLASVENGDKKLSAINSYIQGVKDKKYAFDLRSLINHYKEQEKLNLKSADSKKDGIRVCTIHSSKGLEFPIVILAGLGQKNQNNTSGIYTDKYLGVGMKYYDAVNRETSNTLDMKVIGLKKAIDEREDKLRLFYVALTRAECALAVILPNKIDPCVNPFVTDNEAAWFDYCIRNDAYVESKLKVVNPFEFQKKKEFKRELPKESEPNEEIKAIINYTYPYQSATLTARKYSVSGLNSNNDKVEIQSIDIEENSFTGTAHHQVMQYIDLEARTKDEVKAEIDRMYRENLIQKEQYDAINVDEITDCLNSEIMEKARKSNTYREHKFILSKSADEILHNGCQENVLIQGIIDMLIDGDELIVVDFKHSKLPDNMLIEKYTKQLKLYAEAVAKTYNRYPDKLLLYVFGKNKTIEIK